MKISVFGLGYVGCVSAACLANEGHEVIGVDVNQEKVGAICSGKSPIMEPGLLDIISKTVSSGCLNATVDVSQAIRNSDLALICVGTPGLVNGSLDTKFVARVCEQIGEALRTKDEYFSVVIRSTVLPGTTEQLAIPILEKASGRKAGVDFGVAFNPEFLREGSAIEDFRSPPRTLIGEMDCRSGDLLAAVYEKIDAPLARVDIRVAEMVKYVDNSFHALKIAFANEIGRYCKSESIDSHEVMDIFCMDTKLNLSRTYLKPGNAFGGSCLPKDIRALLYGMKKNDVEAPVLEAILPSNELQKQIAFELIRGTEKKKIGVLGLSFKANTDDLRESPTVNLVEVLIGKGFEVQVYDPNIALGNLVGANRAFIYERLPHIAKLMVDSKEELLSQAEVIVVNNMESMFTDLPQVLRPDQTVIDLARIMTEDTTPLGSRYYGIAW